MWVDTVHRSGKTNGSACKRSAGRALYRTDVGILVSGEARDEIESLTGRATRAGGIERLILKSKRAH